ncbi:hypothetical protein [Martelella soudanensis]|uniref:hypothetical protein n=1 Tax=unclassified Martelella TaxID=2629616 RepID=UPI0015DD9BFA|nr:MULTISPECIES: hypothetical protein [unclassified Martelella]
MKGAFPFAEAPSHRVMPGEIRPRPWQPEETRRPTEEDASPAIPMRDLIEEELDALCMEAIEAATDWRRLESFAAGGIKPART